MLSSLALWSLAPLALAAAPQVDLDGDGKDEKISVTEEHVRVNDATVECSGYEFPCEIHVEDINGSDGLKELSLCEFGPRDSKHCRLYVYKGGALKELELSAFEDFYPSDIVTSGNSIVLADTNWRFFERREKFVVSADRSSATLVAQPFYAVGYALHVDRTFPIYGAVGGGGGTVANVRPDSDIEIVLQSGADDGWFLVKISSGLMGWVHLDGLIGASDPFMGMMMAG